MLKTIGAILSKVGGRLSGSGTGADPRPTRVRRWNSAKNDRLNVEDWTDATGNPINLDLIDNLETIRARATLEAGRNAYLDGIIDTWVTDVVGGVGPTLQVQSDDPAYNAALEAVWRAGFWDTPDINGVMSGVEFLELGMRGKPTAGEFLWQIVNRQGRPAESGPNAGLRAAVATRLHTIDPRRLTSPLRAAEETRGRRITLGVERDERGRPLRYWIEDQDDSELSRGRFALGTTPIPAEQIIHEFTPLESGQVRGVPMLASCLDTVADSRQYREETLTAARTAARLSSILHSDHPEIEPITANEETEIEPGTMVTAPPGWNVTQLKPEQPAVTFGNFNDEMLREYGRPFSMPLMVIKLDSSNHNYSSARFDDGGYWMRIIRERRRLERHLRRLVRLVQLDAERYATADAARARELGIEALRDRPAGEIRFNWVWPTRRHVDPAKEATGEKIHLENLTMTFAEACALHGKDEDAVIEAHAATARKFEEAGLAPPPHLREDASRTTVSDDEDNDNGNGDGDGNAADGGRLGHLLNGSNGIARSPGGAS